MKHLSLYFYALFLVLANIGHHVAGMADLTPEMFVAQTEEEMIAAIDKQRELHQKHLRQRLMMDVDSEPILADKFSGKPGFYHGVASGTSFSFLSMPSAVLAQCVAQRHRSHLSPFI